MFYFNKNNFHVFFGFQKDLSQKIEINMASQVSKIF